MRTLRFRHAGCGVGAAFVRRSHVFFLVCAAAVLVMMPGAGALGQVQGGAGDVPGEVTQTPNQDALKFEPPAPAACLDAFAMASSWVRAWRVPDVGSPATADPATTSGVCVTLRLAGASGRTLARSVVMTTDDNRGDTLRRATLAALSEAEPKLPLEKDATRQARLLEVAQRVLVDVQFAGLPVPIPGETFDDVASRLNPGRDGVMVRSGEGSGAVFPASMLSMNITPAKALEVAAGMLRLPPVPLKELREKAGGNGVEVYRFAARHVAQTEAGGPAEILFRGGRVVALQEMNAQGLRDFASAMSDHLCSHLWRGTGAGAAPLGLRGSYNPLTDTYAPPVAPPREQAVAAMALARYAGLTDTAQDASAKCFGVGCTVLDQLTIVHERETDPLASIVGAASWLLADAEVNRVGRARFADQPVDAEWDGRVSAFRAKALAVLRAGVTAGGRVGDEKAQGGQVQPPAQGGVGPLDQTKRTVVWSPGIGAGERPMVACALAVTATASNDEEAKASARAVVRSLFRDTPQGELVAAMPWLGWAELALVDASAPIPSNEALRQMRALCWSRQVTAEASSSDPDMAGGIVFTSGGGSRTAGFPTWHTLRPLAFLGTMLGDTRLTSDDELQREVLSLVTSLRFARQLAVDQDVAHMIRDPSRALGGVRLAAWEQTVSLDATSLALLGVCEGLHSADVRTK
jgi:hypothetical protein